MISTFAQRVRICIALIGRYGLKRVIISAQEARRGRPAAQLPATFRKYQVFQ